MNEILEMCFSDSFKESTSVWIVQSSKVGNAFGAFWFEASVCVCRFGFMQPK